MTQIQAGEGVRFPHLRIPKGSPRERGSEGTRGSLINNPILGT
jgi:hypothetical protein